MSYSSLNFLRGVPGLLYYSLTDISSIGDRSLSFLLFVDLDRPLTLALDNILYVAVSLTGLRWRDSPRASCLCFESIVLYNFVLLRPTCEMIEGACMISEDYCRMGY